MQLLPEPLHYDSSNDQLPAQVRYWTVSEVAPDYLALEQDGLAYRLGYDCIHNFNEDPHRSRSGRKHGQLILTAQLVVRGDDIQSHPTRPGVPFQPPGTAPAERARIHFEPDLQRLLQRQVAVFDRCILNFELTSRAKPALPSDSWLTLEPGRSTLYPNSHLVRDLSNRDGRLLAAFYGSLDAHAEMVERWTKSAQPAEFNCWNHLMQTVGTTLRAGRLVILEFCPDLQYHALMPAGGRLVAALELRLDRVKHALTEHIRRGYVQGVADTTLPAPTAQQPAASKASLAAEAEALADRIGKLVTKFPLPVPGDRTFGANAHNRQVEQQLVREFRNSMAAEVKQTLGRANRRGLLDDADRMHLVHDALDKRAVIERIMVLTRIVSNERAPICAEPRLLLQQAAATAYEAVETTKLGHLIRDLHPEPNKRLEYVARAMLTMSPPLEIFVAEPPSQVLRPLSHTNRGHLIPVLATNGLREVGSAPHAHYVDVCISPAEVDRYVQFAVGAAHHLS